MAYPLQCFAGYWMPARSGRHRITQVSAQVKETLSDAHIVLVDDPDITHTRHGRILPESYDEQLGIIDIQSAAGNGGVHIEFTNPIKVIHGLSVVKSRNIVGGTLKVYCL